MAKRGRPTKYTKKLAKEICNKISSTSKGLKRLCADNPSWPNKDTIFTWLKNIPEFADQYTKAKQTQIEYIIDEILEIADDASNDYKVDAEGKAIFNNQAVQRARLQIDTRKWLACKLVPRVYGVQPSPIEEDKTPTPSLKGVTDPNEAARIYAKLVRGD